MTGRGMDGLFSLQGKVALVTGGTRGIGRMIAEGLLRQGAKVYVTGRRAEACQAAAAEMGALGTCVALVGNVADAAGITDLAHRLSALEPALDILVNNAGAVWVAPFDSFPESGWDKVMDLNLKTPFFLAQALHGPLRQAALRCPAKVINVASIDGHSVNPLASYSYAASKAGLIHLTRRMAVELAPEGIMVNALCPGAFPTDMNRAARDDAQRVAQRIPAGRVGCSDDIAAAAIYLASRAGDHVAGTTLTIDGGASLVRTREARPQ